jgi:hypothetical protein
MSLIESPATARRMGEKGRDRIMNEFGIEKMVTKTENIYIERSYDCS